MRKNVGKFLSLVPQSVIDGSSNVVYVTPGPIYAPADVLTVLGAGGSAVNLWTDDCNFDVVHKLKWDLDDVAKLLTVAVKHGLYKNSSWCIQNPTGPAAVCDAYCFTNVEFNEAAKKEMPIEYYIKFALSAFGSKVYVASCHV